MAQAATFITGFLIILGLFIYLIRRVSRRYSDRIDATIFARIERVIIAGILLGVVGMFQPWLFVGYKLGFQLLLLSTLAFIVWSHVTPAPTIYRAEE
ncbi:MAG: hypothetical protein HY328_00035 [Chloroflexi bacterium]|nr:hypothetical protein [Chloroflexota bacterium]